MTNSTSPSRPKWRYRIFQFSIRTLFLLTAAGLIGLGLYGLLAYPQPLRKVLAANVMISGVFLVFMSSSRTEVDGR